MASKNIYDESSFHSFALNIFREAGHVFSETPLTFGHSWQEIVYIHSNTNTGLIPEAKSILEAVSNISLLFKLENTFDRQTGASIQFYSAEIHQDSIDRSHNAYEIHNILHPFFGSSHSIITFKCKNQFALSFAGTDALVFLSDWYHIDNDAVCDLRERMDIANTSYYSAANLFQDLVYSASRWYYVYRMSKGYIDYELSTCTPVADHRENIISIMQEALYLAKDEYGSDFVTPNARASSTHTVFSDELEILRLETEINEEYINNTPPYDDEESNSTTETSEYTDDPFYINHDNIDPTIFANPLLMIDWLQKQEDSNCDSAPQPQ